ncbi:MAG: type I-E CRISPR-associated protein Cas6/Cse3/CasE [Chloroflexi bacterium]|nr:type I-E CRISPR-associated protein Cas6/Cse3/CasE [Chloroflexota bacterium]
MTESLQMIRAEIDVRDFQRWMGMRRLQDPDHAMHCLLVESFGKDLAPKPFRVMTPRGGRNGCLYGYARSDADALRAEAGICADPLQAAIIPADRIESKFMPTEWQSGRKLGFDVRVRPVVRLERDTSRIPSHIQRSFKEGGLRPGKECDAFLWKAIQHPKGEMQDSREEVYRDWLAKRLKKCGAAELCVDETTLVSFQRTRAIRRRHSRYSEGPDALMRGNLVITDGDAFANLLAQGVGRHRAYGYGMLLLRPAH